MTTRETATYWVCETCYLASAGYDEHELGYTPKHEPLAMIPGDADVTPGLIREEHDEDCPNFDGDTYLGRSDEPCETRDFSRSTCDGCGDSRGGSRHALTVWSRASI